MHASELQSWLQQTIYLWKCLNDNRFNWTVQHGRALHNCFLFRRTAGGASAENLACVTQVQYENVSLLTKMQYGRHKRSLALVHCNLINYDTSECKSNFNLNHDTHLTTIDAKSQRKVILHYEWWLKKNDSCMCVCKKEPERMRHDWSDFFAQAFGEIYEMSQLWLVWPIKINLNIMCFQSY